MKKDIHPEYYRAEVSCVCGATFITGSTKKSLRVEICSQCHPFYTGTQKIVDSAGRVERFKQRYSKKTRTKSIKVTDTEEKKEEKIKPEDTISLNSTPS